MPKLPGSEAAAEREKTRQELARANELLAGLRTEIRVLESRRDEIRQGIDAETAKLKRERETELDDLVAQAEAAIAPLEADRKQLNETIADLTRKLIKLESDHAGLEGQIAAERATLGHIVKEVAEAKQEKEKAEAHSVSVSAQITKLTSSIQPLREELATLTSEVRDATAQRDATQKEIVGLQTVHLTRKKELELAIVGLERRRNELATTLTGEAAMAKREREDLTLWAEKLAKQEKIIRAREYKVAIAEQKIADNVGLLNL